MRETSVGRVEPPATDLVRSGRSDAPVKSRRTFLLALLGVLLVVPLGAEGLLRAWLRIQNGDWPTAEATRRFEDARIVRELYRARPFLGAGPREGAQVESHGRRAGFNRLGYRSPERAREKPAGTKRIVTAGGSTTFDLLSPSNEQSWPWRLEETLRERDPNVEVWNAGFPGWTSLENLVSLASRDVDLQPDVVVLYQGINDLQPAAADSSDATYEQSHYPLHRRALGLDAEPPGLLERSLVLERLRGLRTDGAGPPRSSQPRLPDRARASFERNVRSFVAVATAHGAQVLLVTQPLRIRRDHAQADREYVESWIPNISADDAVAWLAELNDVLRRLASGGGVALADAAREVDWQDGDFADPMHYTRPGADKLRAYLAGSILAGMP